MMVSSFLVIVLGAAATALVLRQRGRRSLTLSRFAAWSSGTSATSAMLLMAWWFGLHETLPEGPAGYHPEIVRVANTFLPRWAVGDDFPDIGAEGWINALPPGNSFAGKILVINIFDDH